MRLASEDARGMLDADPQLTKGESAPVREYLRRMDTVVYTNL